MSWFRGFRRWGKHLVDGVRRRHRAETPSPHPKGDDSLEREIERAHAMRVGEPLEQPSRQ